MLFPCLICLSVLAIRSDKYLIYSPIFSKTLATGVISKFMIQTREPTPTYTLLITVSSLWTWHFKHGVYATNFQFP